MAAVASGEVKDVKNMDELQSFTKKSPYSGHAVVLFWADYHAASRPGGALDKLIGALSTANPSVTFLRCDSEAADDDILDVCDVELVPTTAYFAGDRLVSKVTGSDSKQIAAGVDALKAISVAPSAGAKGAGSAAAGSAAAVSGELSPALRTRLRALTTQSRVVLFMKGNPEKPRCKFSRAMIELLASHDVKPPAFATFDILEDNDVRQGLKTYSGKSTFPQLYVEGQLIGGLDDTKALAERGPLGPQLLSAGAAAAAAATAPAGHTAVVAPGAKDVQAKCAALVKAAPVMLFMKGNPDAPRCGFSRSAVEILRTSGVEFRSFDILEDEAVRQGLKEFSNWPTFPQLYVKGSLVGGLDVLKEMTEEDEPLAEQLGLTPAAETPEQLRVRLAGLVKKSPVILFMKGNPDAPRCGFSRSAIQLLRDAGTSFDTFDILEDEAVRQGLKEFSNWPTFPQLYVKGSLVGGLDVMKELAEDGELEEALST